MGVSSGGGSERRRISCREGGIGLAGVVSSPRNHAAFFSDGEIVAGARSDGNKAKRVRRDGGLAVSVISPRDQRSIPRARRGCGNRRPRRSTMSSMRFGGTLVCADRRNCSPQGNHFRDWQQHALHGHCAGNTPSELIGDGDAVISGLRHLDVADDQEGGIRAGGYRCTIELPQIRWRAKGFRPM